MCTKQMFNLYPLIDCASEYLIIKEESLLLSFLNFGFREKDRKGAALEQGTGIQVQAS